MQLFRKIVAYIFFGNYFVGLLAVALSFETVLQLGLPVNAPEWYLLLFSGVVLYYTYAYSGAAPEGTGPNPRTEWYTVHRRFVRKSQRILLLLFLAALLWILVTCFPAIRNLDWRIGLLCVLIPAVALLYYGFGIAGVSMNLRSAGWAKPFVIGFVWAGCVSLFPLVALYVEGRHTGIPWILAGWLFLKNWMFCAVNAILFDIKDYEDDTNIRLKTFVVRYGIRFTIFYILVPLLVAGILAFCLFVRYRGLHAGQVTLNLVPFVLTLAVAWSMQKDRPILYYLIVIDGMLLVKACCGIFSVRLPGV